MMNNPLLFNPNFASSSSSSSSSSNQQTNTHEQTQRTSLFTRLPSKPIKIRQFKQTFLDLLQSDTIDPFLEDQPKPDFTIINPNINNNNDNDNNNNNNNNNNANSSPTKKSGDMEYIEGPPVGADYQSRIFGTLTGRPLENLPRPQEVNIPSNNTNVFSRPSNISPDQIPFVPVDKEEVALQIAIYHPKKPKKMQELLVLGSQKLTILRDHIYCLNDQIFEGPHITSGLFFFEGVFYNDSRHPSNLDYSQHIINWISDNKNYPAEKLDNVPCNSAYRKAVMQDTSFEDLTVRIGAYYLYMHQGNCEHYMVVTDVRLVHQSDPTNINLYPYTVFQRKIRRRKCRMCDILSAKWVTFDDRHTTENPCFFCDQCYQHLHYSPEGRLLYNDFTVFPYFHE